MQEKTKECTNLKIENEELKKQLMQKSEVDMFFNTPIEGWSNDPCDICRYKQTLAEIKKIAEKHAPRCNDSANCNYTCEACHLSDLKQILQKINEVENDL